MNTKLVILLGGVGAVHLAVAGLLFTGGCAPEDPPMPPGIYVPKQHQPSQYQENNQPAATEPAAAYPESQLPQTEPEPAPAPAPKEEPAKKAEPANTAEPVKDTRYVVVKGDSLWKIAHKNGLKIEELASYNSLKADAKLKIGQVIYIPAAGTKGVKAKPVKKKAPAAKAPARKDGGKGKAPAKKKGAKSAGKNVPADGIHVVKAGDNFTTIARQYGLKLSDIIHANPGVESNRLKVGQKIRLNENAAPAEIRKAPAKKKAAKAKRTPAPAAASEKRAQPAAEEAAAAAQETQAEQSQSKATKSEMDDLLKDNPSSSEQESDPKALVPDKDRTIIKQNGDAEIVISSDTTVLAFCRKFGVRENEVRRMNPALAGSSRIKAGSRILLSGGGEI